MFKMFTFNYFTTMIDSEGCEENDAIFINMTLTLDLKIL